MLGARPQSQGQLTVKYEKKTPNHPKMASVEESNALKNWQFRMRERRQQQNHLCSKLSCTNFTDLYVYNSEAKSSK